jgi:hypothetical protein
MQKPIKKDFRIKIIVTDCETKAEIKEAVDSFKLFIKTAYAPEQEGKVHVTSVREMRD